MVAKEIINLKVKTNAQFMVLSAIGIIMVVDGHSWSALHLGDAIFPYNSFFMAMFIFISGYFYNSQKNMKEPLHYIKKKCKTLFLPYLFWWFIYLVIVFFVRIISSFYFEFEFTPYNCFIGPFVCGEFGGLNAPAYFVPILFYILCIYTVLRKLFNKIWNETIFFLISVVAGVYVVSYSIQIEHAFAYNSLFMMIMKLLFSMQFFSLGILYKIKVEKIINKLSPELVIVVIILIMSIIKHYIPYVNWTLNRLNFDLNLRNYWTIGYLMPLVTSMLGIIFWLEISKIISPALENNKICRFISNHTFGIMEHHIPCMALINAILYNIDKIKRVPGLDVAQIKKSAWYRYTWGEGTDFYIFYCMGGLIGACLICMGVDKVKEVCKEAYNRNVNLDNETEMN